MAKCGVTNIGGGGGIGSDEVSATKDNVLSGKTYVGADTNDEIGTGTMANNGATGNQSLNAGSSFLVKKGYHAQDFSVGANSLASQTPATASSSDIIGGKIAWVNGYSITGTIYLQSILSFSCTPYSATKIMFTWQNPSRGPFSGVIIIGKTGGYPTNISDGTRYYKGFGNNANAAGISNAIVDGFSVGVTYYFTAFSFTTRNNGEWISNITKATSITIQKITQVFTQSTAWVVPNNVYLVDLFAVGGGQAGDKGMHDSGTCAGWGGNSGKTATLYNFNVSPGGIIYINVGSGGIGGESGSFTGYSGGVSNFVYNQQTICVAAGGDRSIGGSGGGSGVYTTTGNAVYSVGGYGGTDGNDGGTNTGYKSGASPRYGQHSTTRAFGEYNGTLYAGGGGGGGGQDRDSELPGGGGGGGGGAGALATISNAASGTPGTGSGGGGGATGLGFKSSTTHFGGNGGSGVCLIRYIG